jgi:hypothetical protein
MYFDSIHFVEMCIDGLGGLSKCSSDRIHVLNIRKQLTPVKDQKWRPEGEGEWEPQISCEIFGRCPKLKP